MGSPFQEESAELLTLDTKVIASQHAAEAVGMHCENGRSCFKEFMKSFAGENRSTFYDKIKRNNKDFFEETKKKKRKKKKQLWVMSNRKSWKMIVACS